MLIDSHCHLHDREFFSDEQAAKMLVNSRDNDVKQVICIGTSHEDSLVARDFANQHEGVFWTYGVHPNETNEGSKEILSRDRSEVTTEKERVAPVTTGRDDACPEKYFLDPSLVAIGEVGLDYHFEPYNREAQIKLFEEMLQLATDHNLPVSFHIREAFDDFFGVVANFPKITGVVHSFSDNKKNLRKILETTDFYVGVNGMATYSTLPTPPLERTLLETDAPFLTPTPNRGKINEPAYIKDIAQFLSTKWGVEETEVASKTTENVKKLFHLPDSILR